MTVLNDVRARVGHLNLQTFGNAWEKLELELVDLLLSFKSLPISVEWTIKHPWHATENSKPIIKKFNAAANKWLKASRESKNTRSQVSLIELISQPIDHD